MITSSITRESSGFWHAGQTGFNAELQSRQHNKGGSNSNFNRTADKLTDAEKKKIKQENKAKANPEKAAAKKEKTDAKRERRKASGSTKSFA